MKSSQFRSREFDSALAQIMEERLQENEDGVTLIASENHPHPDDVASFMDAVDATFEGGYFEGYPSSKGLGRGRYYQGAESADKLESLTRQRVIMALGRGIDDLENNLGANVQVPTGAGANISVYLSVMKPGDTMVAPSLSEGYGHLSHGADSPNIVGRLFNVHGYGIDPETGLLDYDKLEQLVLEHKPKVVVAGASAYPRDIDWRRIAGIAEKVGAISMADISHTAGLIAAGLLNDPLQGGIDVLTSTTHKTLRGMKGAVILWNRDALAKKAPKGSSALASSEIDFGVFPGIWGGPHMPTIAAHASTFRRAQTPEFREEQRKTQENAAALAQVLADNGWKIITGGTDNHLVLVDIVANQAVQNDATRDGWQAAVALEDVGIVTNKNGVPGSGMIRGTDGGGMRKATPMRPSGLRLGTPAITARGFDTEDVQELGQLLHETLKYAGDSIKLAAIRQKVKEMARKFPLPDYNHRASSANKSTQPKVELIRSADLQTGVEDWGELDPIRAAHIQDTHAILRRSQEEHPTKYKIDICGTEFWIHPGVFPSSYFNDTEFFAENLPVEDGDDFLEIGPGAGICSLRALQRGAAQVVGIDISPLAVENSIDNANLHGLSERVRFVEGNVFSVLEEGDKFDKIFWNIPFGCVTRELTLLEKSVFDTKYKAVEKYIKDAKRHLKPGGNLLIGTSTIMGDFSRIETALSEAGAKNTKIVARKIQEEGRKQPLDFVIVAVDF